MKLFRIIRIWYYGRLPLAKRIKLLIRLKFFRSLEYPGAEYFEYYIETRGKEDFVAFRLKTNKPQTEETK